MKDSFETPIQPGLSCLYMASQTGMKRELPPQWATVVRLTPKRVVILTDDSTEETVTTTTRIVIARRPQQDWSVHEFVIYSDFPEHNCGDEEYGRQDFGGDAAGYSVQGPDGEIIAEFGDDYHDKGRERAEAFIEGYCAANGWKSTVEHDDRIVEGIL